MSVPTGSMQLQLQVEGLQVQRDIYLYIILRYIHSRSTTRQSIGKRVADRHADKQREMDRQRD